MQLGPFTVEANLDDSGILLDRGRFRQEVRWEQVFGAVLLKQTRKHNEPQGDQDDERFAKVLGGGEMLAKMKALEERFETVAFGYRDARGRKKILEFPVPREDPRYLQEISVRLGAHWLGEVVGREQAEKRLGTAPGFFKLALALIVILLLIGAVAAFGLFSLLGPALNFLSIQRMLLDLQDGEYSSFLMRLLTYVALGVLAWFIGRWWRARRAGIRARFTPSVPRR